MRLTLNLCAQLLSCVWLFVTPWTIAHQAPQSMRCSGKNTGVGCHFLLKGSSQPKDQTHISWIGRQILYCLSHMGRPIYYDSCLNWHLHNLRCVCCYLVVQLCPTLCDPMDCNMPGFPVIRYLPEFSQIHVYSFDDAIQPSHSLLPPSSPALNLSQNQGLFQWVNTSH